MGLGEYLLGLVLAALALGPVAAGALAARRRLLPDWTGAPARVAEAVVFLALVWAVAQLLGVVGLLERVPLVLGLALAGAAVWWVADRAAPPANGEPPPAPRAGRLGVAFAAAAAALVLAQWGVQVVEVLGRGMTSSDTISYHGPVAARFFQQGSITPLEFVYSDPIIPFLPFNSELLHAVGMLLLGRDVASPLLNMGWLGFALVSAWCVGRPYGLGPASLVAVCPFLAAPALVTSQAGSAGNDIVAGALMLAAAALLVNAGWRPQAVGLAGVAAGLALAAKVTAIAPVAVLTVGVVLAAPRAQRRRLGTIWTVAVVAAGCPWYLRNLVRVGNPFPAVGIDIGPVHLPSPPLPETFSVSSYLTNGGIWRDFYLPGLNTALGNAWWALLAVVAVAIVAALVAGRPLERALGAAALAAVLAYLVTPRSADGPEGVPFFFQFTLRYMTPGVLIALALLPVLRPLQRFARQPWWYVALGVLLLVCLDDSGIKTGDLRRVALAGAFGLLALAVVAGSRLAPRPAVAAGVAGLLLAAVVVGYPVQRHYLDERYADDPLAFARDMGDTRIAVVGFVRTYPLFGTKLTNRVEQVARRGPNGAFIAIRGCREWRRALDEGRYRYVVTSPPLLPYSAEGVIFGAAYDPKRSPEAAWTRTDPAATPVVRDGRITVFRIDGPLNPAACA